MKQLYLMYFNNVNLTYVAELWRDFYTAVIRIEPNIHLDEPLYVKICDEYKNTQ